MQTYMLWTNVVLSAGVLYLILIRLSMRGLPPHERKRGDGVELLIVLCGLMSMLGWMLLSMGKTTDPDAIRLFVALMTCAIAALAVGFVTTYVTARLALPAATGGDKRYWYWDVSFGKATFHDGEALPQARWGFNLHHFVSGVRLYHIEVERDGQMISVEMWIQAAPEMPMAKFDDLCAEHKKQIEKDSVSFLQRGVLPSDGGRYEFAHPPRGLVVKLQNARYTPTSERIIISLMRLT